MGVFDPVLELGRGLMETLRSFWFEPTVTYQYPEQKREVRPRYRGRHVLKRSRMALKNALDVRSARLPALRTRSSLRHPKTLTKNASLPASGMLPPTK